MPRDLEALEAAARRVARVLPAVRPLARNCRPRVPGAAGADMVIQRRVTPCPFADVKLPKDLAEIDAGVVDKIRAIDRVEAVSARGSEEWKVNTL